ncbi:RNA-directed DNA polymerase, eukaryota, reverse transcriptase zinc-binding domain protein [Tanacetum coccineum]
MGIAVDDDKVTQVARLIGCLTLTTPFAYLGVKVGGVMSRTQAWDGIVNKMLARLSKWKMKTLSIGGRLTLIKSVLGSTPIYYMSMFKVPMQVLKRMETIRSRFFNGVDVKEKRMTNDNNSLWARIIMALHGDNGSLGSSSKHASTWLDIVRDLENLKTRGIDLLGFIKKRVGNGMSLRRCPRGGAEFEQFTSLMASLEGYALPDIQDRCVVETGFVTFIVSRNLKAKLKDDLKAVDDIIDNGEGNDEVVKLRMDVLKSIQDIDKIQIFRRLVSKSGRLNGSQVGGSMHRFKLGMRLESIRSHFFNGHDPNSKRTSWVKWKNVLASKEKGGLGDPMEKMEKWGGEVKSAFPVVLDGLNASDKCCPDVNYKDTVDKLVPIKVKLDSLPTRFNLSRRGLDIQWILCPICGKAAETTSHIFFSCSMVRDIYRKISTWWDFNLAEVSSFEEWRIWLSNIHLQGLLKEVLEGVFYIIWWLVWNFRNKLLFGKSIPLKATLFDDVVALLFLV